MIIRKKDEASRCPTDLSGINILGEEKTNHAILILYGGQAKDGEVDNHTMSESSCIFHTADKLNCAVLIHSCSFFRLMTGTK
ncbi:MAG: hypothetical protein IKH57_15445 [Clostridia bacterium]|nr:hypothetical protein [Clostridia bacterium]